MLKTNSKKYQENFNCYMEGVFASEEHITSYDELYNEFDRVANYDYNIKKFPNKQNRLADFLQGLPIGIEYTNYDILQLDKKLREYDYELTDKQADKILENYWNFMAYQILKNINKAVTK